MLSISQLTLDEQRQVDAVCSRFEDVWQTGRPPSVELFVQELPEGPSRDVLRSELVKIDLEFRRRANARSRDAGAAQPATSSQGSSQIAAQGKVTLTIVAGPHQGERYEFTQHGTLMVGRARDAHWMLIRDPYFSRYHFRIECQPPEARLLDLNSSNGTYVNGERKSAVMLRDGDVISGGDTRIEVRIERPQQVSEIVVDSYRDANVAETVELPSTTPKVPGPRVIAGYQLQRLLGEGAMGQVYLARRGTNGPDVALKVIRPHHLSTPDTPRLFLREASLLSQLKHRRIVECLEVGLHEHQLYLAMEYIPTLDFEQCLRDAPFEFRVRTAAAIMCRVLEGLHFAHQKNIVHRDVKPSNILLFHRENRISAKLADFGLAKNFQDAGLTGISEDNEVKGTLAYIAPEQLIECRYAKPPCDIYAAGVCLYQYISGQLPFDLQDGAAGIAIILNSQPIPLARRVPQVPAALAALVDRALRHDPAERFANANEFRRALMKFARP
jgi:pSer/pThr/pTyr-binding forkhead associated (FHA) protein